MSNRRGQEGMTLGTVVGIILLVLLLVVVIFSFTSAGRDFWAKTLNLRGGTTLDSAVQGCNIAASSNAVDSFCSELKSVTIDGKSIYATCAYLQTKYSDRFESTPSCSTNLDARVQANCKALKKTNIAVNNLDVNIKSEGDCERVTSSSGPTPVAP